MISYDWKLIHDNIKSAIAAKITDATILIDENAIDPRLYEGATGSKLILIYYSGSKITGGAVNGVYLCEYEFSVSIGAKDGFDSMAMTDTLRQDLPNMIIASGGTSQLVLEISGDRFIGKWTDHGNFWSVLTYKT